jgi:hypothetical protein
MKTSHAFIVLPPIGQGLTGDVLRWLARGRVSRHGAAQELITRVLTAMGQSVPTHAYAALRYAGQFGSPPTGWIAAADPVHYAAHLSTLSVHPFPPGSVEPSELNAVFETLHANLGEHFGIEISSCDGLGYVASTEAFDTELSSPELAAGMLDGRAPANATLTRLRGEIEMLLHNHEVNHQREARGEPPINGLWIWGGGTMPDVGQQALPVLVGDDPVLAGYWRAGGRAVQAWPGNVADCLLSDQVVVVCPWNRDASSAQSRLDELRTLMSDRRVEAATFIFREGSAIHLRHRDRLRFWRRESTAFVTEANHG